jgi:hypothetical protein
MRLSKLLLIFTPCTNTTVAINSLNSQHVSVQRGMQICWPRKWHLHTIHPLPCAQDRCKRQHRQKPRDAEKWTLYGFPTLNALRIGKGGATAQWRELCKAASFRNPSGHESALGQQSSSPSAGLLGSINVLPKPARSQVTGFDFLVMKQHRSG